MSTPLFILHLPFLQESTISCAKTLLEGLPADIPFHLFAPKSVLIQCKELRRFHQKITIVDSNNGYLKALHETTKLYPGADLVLACGDVLPREFQWLSKLLKSAIDHPDAAVIGVKTLNCDLDIYSLGRRVVTPLGIDESLANLWWNENDLGQITGIDKIDSVAGTLCYIRRTAFDALSGFDEHFCPWTYHPLLAHLWIEFDDFCLRSLVHGFKIHLDPTISVIYCPPTLDEKQEMERLRVYECSYLEWEKKWGWNPKFPELALIRQRWIDTPICRSVGRNLLDQWDSPQPHVDILILTYNDLKDLRECITHLAKTDYPNATVWILNHACTDGTADYLKNVHQLLPFPVQIIETPINMGIPAANNWLIKVSKAPIIAFLDSDAFVPPHWLSHLVETLRNHPYAGTIGVKVVERDEPNKMTWYDKSFWNNPDGCPVINDDGSHDYIARTLMSTGCCQVYRRKVFEVVGNFDINFGPVSLCDVDHHFATRIAGYNVLYDGLVAVRHTGRTRLKREVNYIRANESKLPIKWGDISAYTLDRTLEIGGRRVTYPSSNDGI